VLLTGTPLQNNVDELFSLLSFLEPRQFSSSEAFMAEFGRLETESQVDKLKAVCCGCSFIELFLSLFRRCYLTLCNLCEYVYKYTCII